METFRFNFMAMGSGCEIVIVAKSKQEALAPAQDAVEEIMRLEKKYSRYLESSVVATINDAAGLDGVVECDEETAFLLRHADAMYRSTEGLFDITSGVLRRAWDFSGHALPDAGRVESLRELIGWELVEFQNDSVRLPRKGMQIDLGGIAKEFAADRVVQILHQKGVDSGYVNMAGDIRIIGPQHDGQPWPIGVRDPADPQKLIASIPLYEGALATSGDYERCMMIDGRRYSHILNPRTGYPVEFWRSVSVVAPHTLMAGSFSTIAMLKERDGHGYLEKTGLLYLAVDCSGKLYHKN